MPIFNCVGWHVEEFKKPLVKKPFVIDTDKLDPRFCVVEIEASGLCHTDIHLRDNDWSIDGMKGCRPGHEGVGRVVWAGPAAHIPLGEVVTIGWVGRSCHHCDHCVNGCGNLCNESVPTPLVSGCFATHVAVDASWVFPYPKEWVDQGRENYIKRAPLACAGSTIAAPLFRYITRPGMRVGVVGMGGLGHLAIMYAAHLGAETVLITRSRSKEAAALKMGAKSVMATEEEGAFEANKASFDLIICTSPAALDWKKYMSLVAVAGTFVLVGIPVDEIPVQLTDLVFRQVTLAGSIVAGETDTRDMIRVACIHDIQPSVEVMSMDKTNEAMERLERGDMRGVFRFVLEVDDAMKKVN